MSKFCEKCGMDMPDNVDICPYCSHSAGDDDYNDTVVLDESVLQSQFAKPENKPSGSSGKSSDPAPASVPPKSSPALIGILVAVAVVVIFIVAFMFLKG